LDIILVNWNSGNRLTEAITSIAQHHNSLVTSVIVIDNASTDASLTSVEALTDLPFPLRIIRNLANRGFGAACNQGAALAGSEYLLFLNPDTRLFQHSLSAPLAFMRRLENGDVGIVGIQLVDEQNHITRSCSRFPSVGIFLSQALGLNRLPGLQHLALGMSEWMHNSTCKVDQIMGAFFFIRHSLFELLGGFDERFFVYFEEVDLSLRAHQAGWRSVYLADAKAFHAGGGASRQVKANRLFYSLRSRLLYGFKHFTSFRAWLLVGVTLLIEPLTRVVFSLTNGGLADVRNTLKGCGMLLQDFPRILRVRHKP
jgi:GT2 family glycosyltransferase